MQLTADENDVAMAIIVNEATSLEDIERLFLPCNKMMTHVIKGKWAMKYPNALTFSPLMLVPWLELSLNRPVIKDFWASQPVLAQTKTDQR